MGNRNTYSVVAAACLLWVAPLVAAQEKPQPSFSFLFENDSFIGADGNYTGGFSLSYETGALDLYTPDARFSRWTSWRHKLPGFGSSRDERLTLAFSGMAFTPENISQREPLPDEPPYAGALVVDANLVSRSQVDQHQYGVRMGWVGPSSQMGNVQEAVHQLTGSEDPQGWDNQLPDEPIANLSYAYSRRIAQGQLRNGWGWDLSPSIGVSAGNYFTGASTSVFLRTGKNMSNSFGTTNIDGGVHGSRSVIDSPGNDWRYQWSLGVAGFGVAHYLPLDGTVFKDSASVEHDNFITVASFGFSIGKGGLQLDVVYNVWSESVDGSVPRSKYAAMNFTWFLDAS